MKGIQLRTTVITELQYKAVLTNLVILTKIGPNEKKAVSKRT